jgi:histidine triad (HIT) family protein
MDCLFCQICQGTVPAAVSYQDDAVLVFDDIHPQAPIHKLIITKRHIATLNDLQEADTALVGHMLQVAQRLAKQLQIAEQGYRVLMNCNAQAGQTVFHIHMHLLGGRALGWPPG